MQAWKLIFLIMFFSSIVVADCSDGMDDDGDGFIDFPLDLGCRDLLDDTEENPGKIVEARFNRLGEDVGDEFIYNKPDGYKTADVRIVYHTQHENRLTGRIIAKNLKPGFTYQLKLVGLPSCLAGSGDDWSNNVISRVGRDYCPAWKKTTLKKNLDVGNNEDNICPCPVGYLPFGFITVDAQGNGIKDFETDESYHVLYCSGRHNEDNNKKLIDGLAPENSKCDGKRAYCPSTKVATETEKYGPGGLLLPPGDYTARFALTEESFHQNRCGYWATVLERDIKFTLGKGNNMSGFLDLKKYLPIIFSIAIIISIIFIVIPKFGKTKHIENQIKKLEKEIDVTKEQIIVSKKKFYNREIDEESLREIVVGYEKRIIDHETMIKKLHTQLSKKDEKKAEPN